MIYIEGGIVLFLSMTCCRWYDAASDWPIICSQIGYSVRYQHQPIICYDADFMHIGVNEALAPSLIKSQLEGVIKEKLSAILQRVVPTKGENTGMLTQDLGTDYFSMMEQMTITRWWPAEQMLVKNGWPVLDFQIANRWRLTYVYRISGAVGRYIWRASIPTYKSSS